MLRKPRPHFIAAALVLLAATAASALAAQPRPGVSLYGPTSWKGSGDPVSYVFLKVSKSGKRVATFAPPSVCGVIPHRPAKNFPISSSGKFSGTRKLTSNAHGATFDWTVKITGEFTARTKAKGTFSASVSGARTTCRTGKQTWKAPKVGSST